MRSPPRETHVMSPRLVAETERLQLLSSLILAVTDATDLESGLGVALEKMGTRAGWAAGQAWLPAPGGVLQCCASWYCARPGLEAFRAESERTFFPPGIGLPGRAWADRRRVWVHNVGVDGDLPRAAVAAQVGLKAGVAMPIFARTHVAAVVEFFMWEVREEDERHADVLETIAADLGLVVARKAAEDALRASELQSRALIETAKDAIISADLQGTIVSWNKGAEDIFGHARSKILGQPLAVLLPERYRDAHRKRWHRYRATGDVEILGRTLEFCGLREHGQEFPCEASVAGWKNQDGQFVTAVIRDTSERKGIDAERLRLASIVDSSDDAIISKTLEGIITSWNEGAHRIFGYTAEEMLGKSNYRLVPTDRVEEENHILRRLARGERVHLETVRVRKGGRHVHVSVTSSPMYNSAGDIVGASEVARDISELRRAEESERLLEAETLARRKAERAEAEARELARRRQVLVEAASAFAVVAHEREIILQETARYCVELLGDGCLVQLTGQDNGEGRVVALYHRDPEYRMKAEKLLTGGRPLRVGAGDAGEVLEIGSVVFPTIGPSETRFLARFAEREFLECFPLHSLIVAPLPARDGVSGLLLLWRHSPERPYTQEDLSWLTDFLDRASLAVDNARLYRDLKAAVEIRDDFLAVAGHELKTPLSAMLMQIQNAQRGAANKKEPAVLAERLSKAASSGKRLERLINQLLDVSRITAGRLRLEPETINLSEVVKDVIVRFSDASPISSHCPEQVVGYWDRMRMDQVVNNLVANAVKYGRGKPVEVDLRAEEGEAVLRVVDQGIGIDAEHQRKIFERFERAVTTREFGGFGLGLWISRQIVEASGGRIEVQSLRGEGATFTVRLPMKEGGPPSRASHAGA